MATRSKGLVGKMLQANKRARTQTVLEDKDEDADSAVRTVSEYDPSSALSQIDNNSQTKLANRRRSAPGKENITIFSKHDTPIYTRGPRGRNKRTHDDEVNLTLSTLSIRFTNRVGL
jgi:hypothetical protein